MKRFSCFNYDWKVVMKWFFDSLFYCLYIKSSYKLLSLIVLLQCILMTYHPLISSPKKKNVTVIIQRTSYATRCSLTDGGMSQLESFRICILTIETHLMSSAVNNCICQLSTYWWNRHFSFSVIIWWSLAFFLTL